MNIKKNSSLYSYNSFGVDHNSSYFIEIESKSQIINFLKDEKYLKEDKLILGGGSNILFTKDFDGVVLFNKIKGINKIKEDKNHIYLRVGSGENWDKFVSFCVDNKYYGIENLSLIPSKCNKRFYVCVTHISRCREFYLKLKIIKLKRSISKSKN